MTRQQLLQKELKAALKRLSKVEKLPFTLANHKEIQDLHQTIKRSWMQLEDIKARM